MSNPVIFKDLPATFPEEDKNKTPAAIGSIAVHILAATILILVPLLIPQRIEQWHLLTLIAPIPPPPPALAPVHVETVPKPAAPEIQPVIKIEPGTVIMPTEIPKEIARIVEDVSPPVSEGIPGGIPGGTTSRLLRGVLLQSVKPAEIAAPPPPPPPSPPPALVTTPVRVG